MGYQVIYSSFPTLTPSKTDVAVGAVTADNVVVCRRCIKRLGLDWNSMKYITNSRAKLYIYNCSVCGWQLMKKRIKGLWYGNNG